MTLTLPKEKQQKISFTCRNLRKTHAPTIREVAKTIGMIVATFEAVPLGPLYYRAIELDKIEALKINKDNFEAKMNISLKATNELCGGRVIFLSKLSH